MVKSVRGLDSVCSYVPAVRIGYPHSRALARFVPEHSALRPSALKTGLISRELELIARKLASRAAEMAAQQAPAVFELSEHLEIECADQLRAAASGVVSTTRTDARAVAAAAAISTVVPSSMDGSEY
eukprot:6192020-Pleurochrysis_carterae.AAC.1